MKTLYAATYLYLNWQEDKVSGRGQGRGGAQGSQHAEACPWQAERSARSGEGADAGEPHV